MAHFGARPSSTRIPSGQRNPMQTMINEPKEGDYYTIKQDGEDWPIVICDEEVIQTFFTHSLRPTSAREADGNWGNDYKAGGFSVTDRRFPAIYLGSLEFIWAPMKELEPIEIDMGRAIEDSTAKPLLAKAWREYISQYRGGKIFEWKYLDHWKAKLHARRPDNTTPSGAKKERLPAGKLCKRRKRKCTPVSRYPPGYRSEELDDDESEDLFLRRENSGRPQIKRESISSDEMDGLYCDPDPPYPTSSQSSKRSKLDLSGRFYTRPSTPLGAGTGKLATPRSSSARHATPCQVTTTDKKGDANDPDTVMIYVDNPHRRFRVKRAGLDASPLLSNLLAHHPDDGWYIMSPLLSSLDADDFQPVGEYIDRREYHPNILDDGTRHVRLEGDPNPDTLRRQTVRCGRIYRVAQTLEMRGLQDLALRKLKALEPDYGAPEILTVIGSVFDTGSAEMRRYLTRHVADHYWALVLAEPETTAAVMCAHEELARGVFGMLSGMEDGMEGGVGAVKEEVGVGAVKEEVEGDSADEVKGGRQSDPSQSETTTLDETETRAQADDAGQEGGAVEEKQEDAGDRIDDDGGTTGEATKDAGVETVEVAVRQSVGGYREEDWAQLVPKQSNLFEAF